MKHVKEFKKLNESFEPHNDWYYELREYRGSEFLIVDPYDYYRYDFDWDSVEGELNDKNLDLFNKIKQYLMSTDTREDVKWVIVKISVDVVE